MTLIDRPTLQASDNAPRWLTWPERLPRALGRRKTMGLADFRRAARPNLRKLDADRRPLNFYEDKTKPKQVKRAQAYLLLLLLPPPPRLEVSAKCKSLLMMMMMKNAAWKPQISPSWIQVGIPVRSRFSSAPGQLNTNSALNTIARPGQPMRPSEPSKAARGQVSGVSGNKFFLTQVAIEFD